MFKDIVNDCLDFNINQLMFKIVLLLHDVIDYETSNTFKVRKKTCIAIYQAF